MNNPGDRRWSSFALGVLVGLLLGIPLGVMGLIVLAQILTAMIALP